MNLSRLKWFKKGLVLTIGAAGGAYVLYAAKTGAAYGKAPKISPADPEYDPLMDRFMPDYEVRDRHQIRVQAPADYTFKTVCEMSFDQSRLIRGLFKAREIILFRGKPILPEPQGFPKGLVAVSQAIGWGVLAEVKNREIILGAVTQPWIARPEFRAVKGDKFSLFKEPGYVKIVWSIKAEEISRDETLLSVETRAIATDVTAKKKFKPYWAFLSPGIKIIRWVMLREARKLAFRFSREHSMRSAAA